MSSLGDDSNEEEESTPTPADDSPDRIEPPQPPPAFVGSASFVSTNVRSFLEKEGSNRNSFLDFSIRVRVDNILDTPPSHSSSELEKGREAEGEVSGRIGSTIISTIPCSRLLLASASEVFRKMLFGPMSDSTSSSYLDIEVDSDHVEAFQSMIEFCHTGIVRFPPSDEETTRMKNILGLVVLADRFMISQLGSLVESAAVEQTVNRSNALGLVCSLEKDGTHELIRERAWSVIDANIVHFLQDPSIPIEEMRRDVFEELLRRASLDRLPSKYRVYDVIGRWIADGPASRGDLDQSEGLMTVRELHRYLVMEHVRLHELLPFEMLKVQSDGIVESEVISTCLMFREMNRQYGGRSKENNAVVKHASSFFSSTSQVGVALSQWTLDAQRQVRPGYPPIGRGRPPGFPPFYGRGGPPGFPPFYGRGGPPVPGSRPPGIARGLPPPGPPPRPVPGRGIPPPCARPGRG